MIRRALLMPVRLALGLPPIYGLTIKSRVLQLLRKAGLHRGPIHFQALVKPVNVGLSAGQG